MLTIFLITKNRDEGLIKCLDSVVKLITGNYNILVANCSDDWVTTANIIEGYKNAISICLAPDLPIHACYNTLIKLCKTDYAVWLADDIVVEKDFRPLLRFLRNGYDLVALPMVDIIEYEHPPINVDKNGCFYTLHYGKRFFNHGIYSCKVWQHKMNTKSDEQIDLWLHQRTKNVYWPDGHYLTHVRSMDKTRQNRIL